MENARITVDGTSYELPTVVGTQGEKAIDISDLRSSSGYVTLDPGFQNTAACRSAITF